MHNKVHKRKHAHESEPGEELLAQLLNEFHSCQGGLSPDEVTRSRMRDGDNSFLRSDYNGWALAWQHIRNPFMLMFFVMVVTLSVMSEWANAFLILCCMVINSVVSFMQEYRAMHKLSLLKNHLELSIMVCRSGVLTRVLFSDIVCGDIVSLEPGDVIPADVRFIKTRSLLVDESPLTGEAGAIPKTSVASFPAEESGCLGYAGTTVIQGTGTAVVYKVGKNSSWGRLAVLTLETLKTSTLARQTQQLASFIMRLVIAVLGLVFCANVIIKNLIIKSETVFTLADLLVFSVALAVTVIPEALPVVVTICLARGASRMAAHSVVVKRLSAIEDLGRIEVLCTDKTGTLTENKLTIVSLYGQDEQALIYSAAFCGGSYSLTQQPFIPGFDHAIYQYINAHYKDFLSERNSYAVTGELPFDPVSRIGAVSIEKAGLSTIIIRGSYEQVIERCMPHSSLMKNLPDWLDEQEKHGNRVIAVASAETIKESELSYEACTGLDFIGAIAFSDPIKKTAHKAVSRAQKLGIKVKVISGDSAPVCATVAQQIGLIPNLETVIITGTYFASLSEEEKYSIVKENSVFARILPEQKYEIITLLQKEYMVGYVGDGINDAPALRAANVSLVVKNASALAQDVADIVLLKDSLLAVIDGISEGRKIVTNTLKYIVTTLAGSFGNFYSLAIVSFLIDYLPMLPSQILLLNIMSDIPLIALSTDGVDASDIERPCRYNFRDIIIIALIIGSIGTVFDFVFFAIYHRYEPAVLQTGWFVYAVFREVVLVFSLRTRKVWFRAHAPSACLIAASVIILMCASIMPFVPLMRTLLHFTVPVYHQFLVIIVLILSYFIVVDYVKWWYYRRGSKKAAG